MAETINPFGKKIIKVSTDFCGRELSLEVGRVGFRQAPLFWPATATPWYWAQLWLARTLCSGMDYFPLRIDYEEKFYAAGKISGSRFIKREGRPTDDAILIGRLIDRPIRPLWPKGYRHEVQGVATVLSMDPDFRPDAIAMIAMSAAFMLTGAPFDGPVAGVRVGLVDGKPKAFASSEQLDNGELDLVVAGTKDAIMMVEAGADEVAEATVIEALEYAQKLSSQLSNYKTNWLKKLALPPRNTTLLKPDEDIEKRVETWLAGKLGAGLRAPYPERNDLVADLRKAMHEHFEEELGERFRQPLKAITTKPFKWLSTKTCAKASLKTISALMAVN